MLLLFLAWRASAQTSLDPVQRAVEYCINLNTDENTDVEELSLLFEDLIENPIFPNKNSPQDLKILPFLSEFQIISIIDYLKEFGDIKSMNELRYIPGVDQELAEILEPFITLTAPKRVALNVGELKPIRQRIMMRSGMTLQRAKGFKDTSSTKFLGSRPFYASSYTLSLGKNITANLYAEKDAGEKPTPRYLLYDSFGGSILATKPIKYANKVIIGDYRLNLGQGLLSWSGFSPSRSSDPSTIMKRAAVVPKRSFDEIYFYRGIATEYSHKRWYATAAYSNRMLDGRISAQDSSRFTLQTTGLHRTQSEMKTKGNIRQEVIAGSVGYFHQTNRININYITKTLSHQGAYEAQKGISIDYQARFGKVVTFGEMAADQQAAIALMAGTSLAPSNSATATIVYRHYPQRFDMDGNNSFGESSRASNDRGVYIGVKVIPKYRHSITAYADMHTIPHPKFRVSKPSSGHEVGISSSGYISKQIDFRVRYRYKTRERDVPQNESIASLTEYIFSHKGDATLVYTPEKNSEIRLGTIFSTFKTESSSSQRGTMLYVDFRHQLNRWPIKIYARHSIFDVDSFDTAIYSYESDLPGLFSTALSLQKGTRSYVMLRAKATRRLNIWLKYLDVFYAPPTETISEGANQILGNRRSEVRVQATLDF